jgi:O-methyltransferase involved in polyketide biosynthesis
MDGPKETANDAIMSKVSASSLGYYSDDFSAKLASEFLAPYGAPPRRVPMMNRGTWARVAAMDRVVDEFLSMPFPPCHGTPPKRQIVSLGAGFDSRFFRLKQRSIVARQTGTIDKNANVGVGDGLSRCSYGKTRQSQRAAPLVVNGKVINARPSSSTVSFQGQEPGGAGGQALPAAAPWRRGEVAYFEVDFGEIVARKEKTIVGTRALLELAYEGCLLSVEGEGPRKAAEEKLSSFAEEEDEDEDKEVEEDEEKEERGNGPQVDHTYHSLKGWPASSRTEVAESLESTCRSGGGDRGGSGGSGAASVYFSSYRLVEADLSDCDGLENALRAAGLDPALPTLLIAECALVYMPPEDSASLISWAARTFDAGTGGGEALFALFEMITPDDAFGRVMMQNLRLRGCELYGMSAYPDPSAQKRRCLEPAAVGGRSAAAGGDAHRGWTAATAGNMLVAYEHFVDQAERMRIEGIELLDEVEEWQLIMKHYCLVLAAVGEACHSFVEGRARTALEPRGSGEVEARLD